MDHLLKEREPPPPDILFQMDTISADYYPTEAVDPMASNPPKNLVSFYQRVPA